MLSFTINPTKEQHLKLVEKASSMNLAKEVIKGNLISEPILTEGKSKYIGFQEINNYLEEQKHIITEWYACRCGTHYEAS